jgi:uncharacterized protein YlzI (FlbEa/FlbD family)
MIEVNWVVDSQATKKIWLNFTHVYSLIEAPTGTQIHTAGGTYLVKETVAQILAQVPA